MFSDPKFWRLTSGRALAALMVTGTLLAAATVFAMANRPLPSEEVASSKDPNATITPKAIGVEALPKNEYNIISEKPAPQSAALFVGVNNFSEDNGLADLKCAVNDAVEQAFVFVHELKLIKPQNCILSLSGKPTTDRKSVV